MDAKNLPPQVVGKSMLHSLYHSDSCKCFLSPSLEIFFLIPCFGTKISGLFQRLHHLLALDASQLPWQLSLFTLSSFLCAVSDSTTSASSYPSSGVSACSVAS
ncbi:hypothetical protein KP509_05G011200 [Ceratopteris richardii]|uniref:Uncharacterized protein n=1 Tax=Ceratopteris richardii TaxID=49495 RepID=A0A8T2UW05_CERRI|nr:hypothetical protein KP509_05G011200 [Ceratopteris richardii]